MCCPLVFEFSVGIGGFVIGLGQISFFFSLCSVLDLTWISDGRMRNATAGLVIQSETGCRIKNLI